MHFKYGLEWDQFHTLKTGVSEISVTYHQDADTNDNRENIQYITLTTQDPGYINITIPEGKHWSIDEAKDLVEIVEDFKERVGEIIL